MLNNFSDRLEKETKVKGTMACYFGGDVMPINLPFDSGIERGLHRSGWRIGFDEDCAHSILLLVAA
jgi:hypothetical protein